MIFALKPTLVLHSGLQSVMLFIFHMFHVHMDLFSLSLPVPNRLQLYFLTPYPWVHSYECKHCALRHTHTHTQTPSTHCTHTHHSIHQSVFFLSFLFSLVLCVLSPYLFTPTLSLAHNQRAPRNAHKQVKHTQARTHKVARLVGAMAAALLRSPRVAPGARLPVVCQSLRVEFIQIKAVEWGPSPRMPRPSPSSAFRRWE